MRSDRGRLVAVVLALAGCGGASEAAPKAEPAGTAVELARRARAGDASVGPQACAIVREHPVDPRLPRIRDEVIAAHAVLAATHTECAELAAALVDVACDPRLDCDEASRLCTSADLDPLVERVLDELVAGHAVPSDVDDRRVLLAAGHALPALPGRVRKQSERRRYAVVQPDAPECTAAPADVPCRCLDTPAAIAEGSCASTHSDEHAVHGCRVRVDDDRHQIVVLARSDRG